MLPQANGLGEGRAGQYAALRSLAGARTGEDCCSRRGACAAGGGAATAAAAAAAGPGLIRRHSRTHGRCAITCRLMHFKILKAPVYWEGHLHVEAITVPICRHCSTEMFLNNISQ